MRMQEEASIIWPIGTERDVIEKISLYADWTHDRDFNPGAV